MLTALSRVAIPKVAPRAIAASGVVSSRLLSSNKTSPKDAFGFDECNWVPPLSEADRQYLERKMEMLKRERAEKKAKKERDAEVRHHMWE